MAKSLQDILTRCPQSGFVERQEQTTLFHQNLALPLDDDRQRIILEETAP